MKTMDGYDVDVHGWLLNHRKDGRPYTLER